jgi:hypothetical protein
MWCALIRASGGKSCWIVVVALGFFGLSFGYAAFCDRL